MSTTTPPTPLNQLESLMQSNGLNISGAEWDVPIYRVLSLHWFKDMITNRRNGLVRPYMWDDPFENFFLKCKVQTATGEIGSIKPIHDAWYGQCWTMHRDSDAMWRIYSSDKMGIRVSTTIRKLFAEVCDTTDKFDKLKYFIGKVEYEDRSKIEQFIKTTSFRDLAFGGQGDKFARTLCIKRPEFKHENEVRLLIQDAEHKVQGDVLTISFAYDSVLSEVVCDPRLDSGHLRQIEE